MVKMIKMMSATDIKVLKVVETGDTADLTVTGKQDGKRRERRRPHGQGRRRVEGPAGGVEELDRKIRSMHVPAFLAKRFLSGSRRGLPKTVSLLALFGVALGAASLVVAMGLMSGYRHDLAERIAGTSAEVIAMPEPGANARGGAPSPRDPAERRRRRAHGASRPPSSCRPRRRRAPTPS